MIKMRVINVKDGAKLKKIAAKIMQHFEVDMIANIIVSAVLMAGIVFSLRSIVKQWRDAKRTGNMGCIGCSCGCSSDYCCHTK
ncbi:MAG: FeoB-associated Cys-rich membrane protein [Treponema sp.]|nr:FeoB-associated Cys-rich membrane protein [Treponema sp.]